jgi:hypothetical protein
MKAYALSTWGTKKRVDDAFVELLAGLRQVDPQFNGIQPAVLAVSSDLAQDMGELERVLKTIDGLMPLEYKGRTKIWVLEESAGQLGNEAMALIQRLR